ncbi:uroporphyrinogen-III C-methyltransferase [Polynucleobacter sp. MWH-HuK1]|uniref:uroporphyrinogen-III C-methyltransferase n=1 Tax=Polynucleobacter sp. MWH-HuK1 TaxID=1743158 RepID=UPI001C0BA45C|nr:uroporphyrinogen-III C-methyltransferase [Polynucleobacter sp. MWH-HuK1]MBU3566550.1 uroporphyrinogen-III C-methyltransferase [Polynucleobacter sp. MWH-HuK1]
MGKVYLVGAGPGAVDLITVRGAKLLERADIVFYDALVDPAILKLCPQAITVAVGKRCGKLSSAQQFINKRLVDAAHKHQIIVRLKGGDPMLFGRTDEEIQTLKAAGIEVSVVPGITAALAGAASIQQSLTLRGISRSVAFVTLAQGNENVLEANPTSPIINPNADTLVYYMGRKDAARIAMKLIKQNSQGLSKHSADTPVHVLEAVSTPQERQWISTLAELAAGKADAWFDSSSPTLIMIGEALRNKSQTSENLESSGAKINDSLQNSQVLANSRRSA